MFNPVGGSGGSSRPARNNPYAGLSDEEIAELKAHEEMAALAAQQQQYQQSYRANVASIAAANPGVPVPNAAKKVAATADDDDAMPAWYENLMSIIALATLLYACLRAAILGADFQINALASVGWVPADWKDNLPDVWLLGKVSVYHLYQVPISAIEVVWFPFKMNGFIPERRKDLQTWQIVVWCVAFFIGDLGAAFTGLSLQMQTWGSWQFWSGVSWPKEGPWHTFWVTVLGIILSFGPEQGARRALQRLVQIEPVKSAWIWFLTKVKKARKRKP